MSNQYDRPRRSLPSDNSLRYGHRPIPRATIRTYSARRGRPSAYSSPLSSPEPNTVNLPASTNAVPEHTELFPKRSRAVDKDHDKEKAPKKRRKNSTSMTPQPNDSRATSSDPRPAPANGKGKARASLPSALSLTARQQGLEAKNAAAILAREAKEKDAASARASPYVVDNDAPLPKVPRKGMGDDQPRPPESDIRGEAAFILEAAAKHRQERLMKEAETARTHPDRPASPPLTGEDEDIPPLRVALPNGNGDHSTSYQTPAHTGVGFDTGAQSSQAGPSQSKVSPRGRPEITTDEEFAAQFEAIKDHYTEQENHIMPVFSDDPRPHRFHQGQKPTVVLAPQQGRQPGRIRDKHERAYLEGFDGLPEEFEREIAGFVNNVRNNMKHVVDFYFDHPTLRRDAFIEKIGRELSILGAQLTSDGEAALLPPRAEQ